MKNLSRKELFWLSVVSLSLLLTPLVSIMCVTGCTTHQQKIAYRTLYGVEVTTTTAYDGYAILVAKGHIATNSVPQVSHAYNIFQDVMHIAVIEARFNTNALAPANVIAAGDAVINLISTITRN